MAHRGSFQTARKESRDWFIDEDEVYPDNRKTQGGKYVDWRNSRPNLGKKKSGRPKAISAVKEAENNLNV